MNLIKSIAIAAGIGLVAAGIFVYSGAFNAAADEPHSPIVFKLAETVRERSVAMRARSITVPPLDDPSMIAAGGADYNEMCTGCHLKPGMEDSELRAAMYPQPPDLTKVTRADPAQTFWIIKHGIKMSAMPAWGATHDDQRMWAMVAFLKQLPRLTPDQYQILTARSEEDEGAHAHGDHQDSDSMEGMPGMDMPGMKSDAHSAHAEQAEDGGSPEAAVESFLRALSSGNAKEAQRWLAPDVLVYESGHAERSRDQYVKEHMSGDMEFLSSIKTERLEKGGGGGSDMAWVSSRTRLSGKSGGKPVDVLSTETMVLAKGGDGWRIKHIHWSSSPNK